MQSYENYIDIWLKLKDLSKKTHRFSDFIDNLEPEEIYNFILDVFQENTINLNRIYNDSESESIIDVAFQQLTSLSIVSLERISDQLELMYDHAIDNRLKLSKLVAQKILAITAINKIGLSKKYIVRKVQNPNLKKFQKLELLLLLSNLSDTVGEKFWLAIDVKKEPYLAPAVISAFKSSNPEKALLILEFGGKIIALPDNNILFTFKEPIKMAILNLIKDGDRASSEKYLEIVSKIKSPWIKETINQILKNPKFNSFKKLIESVNLEASELIEDKLKDKTENWEGQVSRTYDKCRNPFDSSAEFEKLKTNFLELFSNKPREVQELLSLNYNAKFYSFSNHFVTESDDYDLVEECSLEPKFNEIKKSVKETMIVEDRITQYSNLVAEL